VAKPCRTLCPSHLSVAVEVDCPRPARAVLRATIWLMPDHALRRDPAKALPLDSRLREIKALICAPCPASTFLRPPRSARLVSSTHGLALNVRA